MPNKKKNISEGIEKLTQDKKFSGKIILKDMLPVKMSEVILNFAKPFLDKADLTNKIAAKRAIQLVIEIWNYAIALDKARNDAGTLNNSIIISAMTQAAKQNLSFDISDKDYHELPKRKRTIYPDNNYFVIEHSVRWSDNDSRMYLAVATGDASGIKL